MPARLDGTINDIQIGRSYRYPLERLRVPALVVAGDVDRLTPPASAVALNERLPDARLVVLEGAGHCSMLDRPEEFNEAVERFLREVLGLEDSPARAGAGIATRRRRGADR